MREHSRQTAAGLTSLTIHVAAASLLLLFSTNQRVGEIVKQSARLVAPVLDFAPLQSRPMQGGGGGGDNSPLPPNKGALPRAALRQFTPPMAVVNNQDPKLILEPTIIASAEANLPHVNMTQYGDPFGQAGPLSSGPGSGGGIGAGANGGVGPGKGPGFGPGEGGGVTGPVFPIGGSVSAPILIHMVEPEYSEEARKAKYQGTVSMAVIIDERGRLAGIRVLSSPGMGLDEKAVKAVKQWLFRPGMRNGKPVAVTATVDVNFRLL